jgi:type IV pilus assembly protein PilO
MILGILDDILERPTNQKVGLIALATFLIGALDWQFWYGPQSEHLSELQDQVLQHRTELEAKKIKTNARAEAEREVRDLSADLKRAQAQLPDQREIADLLSTIAASGRSAGLDIVLFRQKPEAFHDFYASVPVQMEMRGTFQDVVNFVDRVKGLDRIVNIQDIQLSKPRLDGDRMLLDAACTATTFRFLDETERARIAEEKKKAGGAKKNAAKDDKI